MIDPQKMNPADFGAPSISFWWHEFAIFGLKKYLDIVCMDCSQIQFRYLRCPEEESK